MAVELDANMKKSDRILCGPRRVDLSAATAMAFLCETDMPARAREAESGRCDAPAQRADLDFARPEAMRIAGCNRLGVSVRDFGGGPLGAVHHRRQRATAVMFQGVIGLNLS
jgi:hypothetical protein